MRLSAIIVGMLLATVWNATPVHAQSSPAYVTSWIGNTFGGANNTWVQGHIQDMVVMPSGRVYATTWWDEDGHEACVFENGKVIGNLKANRHSLGRTITANEKYVFTAVGGHGKKTPVLRRFQHHNFNEVAKPTPIGDLQNEVRGLAATGKLLFISLTGDNLVRVWDADTLKELRTFPVERPGKLAVDKAGSLWIVQFGSGTDAGVKVLHYKDDGTKLPEEITDVVDIQALAVDHQGRLLLGENGPRNQVLIYDISGAPKLVGTFGRERGIAAGKPGEVQPDKFDGITGVGTDAKGNFYVACDGRLRDKMSADGSGTVLRALTPDGKQLWENVALEFVDGAGADPQGDAAEVFTKFHHYRMDYSKPAGKEWTWVGYTLDRFKYPNDPRLYLKHQYVLAVRRIGGQRFMFTTTMWPNQIIAYRFDGLVAVPSAMITGQGYASPPNQPANKSKDELVASIWRDRNGDGDFQADEYTPIPPAWFWGWCVDSRGNIWGGGGRVVRYGCAGLDDKGNPHYPSELIEVFKLPEPVVGINRLWYDAGNDAMFIAGRTKANNGKVAGDSLGLALVRVDSWSKEPKARWETRLPSIKFGRNAMTAAGKYVFVATPDVYVYDADTGTQVALLKPGREIGGISGAIDVTMGVTAHQRADGEYLIFVEEDARHKVTLYRWRPNASVGNAAVPMTTTTETSIAAATPAPTPAPAATPMPELPLPVDSGPIQAEGPNYRMSWIGNTGSGRPTGKTGTFLDLKGQTKAYKLRDYTQMDVKEAFVLPDGSVVTTTWFDEGHQEVSIYKDGKVQPLPDMHYRVGLAVTADADYVYMDWVKNDKAKKECTNIIRRCRRSDMSEFDETPLNTYTGNARRVLGLALHQGKLFVSNQAVGGIQVLAAGDMKILHTFEVPKARKLAIDPKGVLWIIVGGDKSDDLQPGLGAKVVRYSADGQKLPGEITDAHVPTAIAIDNQGRVLLADSDLARNHIRIYTASENPQLVGTFGSSAFAGTPGEVKPDKFDWITGIGTDAQGNYYVCWNGGQAFCDDGRIRGDAQGAVIRSLTPAGALRWERLGLHFIDNADADPADERQVYAKTEHYVMDYDQPAGASWKWVGYTLDKIKYPQDPRVNVSHSYTSQMLRLGGKLFMVTSDQYKDFTTLYRFEGELAIPCVVFSSKNRGEYPPNRPANLPRGMKYLWRDGAGGALDGAFQAGEYQTMPASGWAVCSYFDTQGTLWQATGGNKIQRTAFEGLDSHGVPIYRAQGTTILDIPTELSKVYRLEYDAARDVMYLMGFTKERPTGAAFGSEILRYDNWSKAPALRSRMVLPLGEGDFMIFAFSATDEYVFAGMRYGQPLYVYDSRTGQLLTRLAPGESMGGPDWYGGGLDCPQSVRSYRRSNGEILIFTEEVSYAKVLMHQWRPPQRADAPSALGR